MQMILFLVLFQAASAHFGLVDPVFTPFHDTDGALNYGKIAEYAAYTHSSGTDTM